MSPEFDAVVVGAGPAGSVTALLLARAGRSVALLERGDPPGSKNLSGGVLYPSGLREVLGDAWAAAPLERAVTRTRTVACTPDGSVGVDHAGSSPASVHDADAVTVLRAGFDAWLASRAEEAGALLLPGVRVDEPLRAGGRVVGVRAGDDELTASVVVAADGVTSFLARAAGVRSAPEPAALGLGVKTVVELPASVLEDRFGVPADGGATWTLVGDCTRGLPGGGFLYTNRASVSAGVVVRLDALTASGLASRDIVDHFLAHPAVAPLLAGGTVREFGAHLVAEHTPDLASGLVADGLVVVGDAAGLVLNTGLAILGMDLAVESARAAAQGVLAALAAGDTSASGLAGYPAALRAGVVGSDVRTYARADAFLRRGRLYGPYGDWAARVLADAHRHDGRPRRRLAGIARDALAGSPLRVRDLVADAVAAVRSV